MKDAKKFIKKNMGFSKSSIPGSTVPNDVEEDTCPLCGKYMPLDNRGYCGTEECSGAARQTARKMAREAGGNVSGLYYKFGDLEVINFSKLERWEEPKQVKHPDMCQSGECTRWALSADYLCGLHRLEENKEQYRTRKQARRKGTDRKRNKQKVRKLHGNKIKGLGDIKIKK